MTTIAMQPAGQGPIVGVPIQNKAPITQKLSAALSVLSAILASAGFSSDYWIIHDTDSDTILHSGLFKTCWGPFCVSHVEALIKEPVWIVEVIAGLAGIGLMALSSILKVYKMCTNLSSKSIIGLDRVVAILGTLCMMILLGAFLGTTQSIEGSYSWSMYIFCVGTGLGLMSSILTCMYYNSIRA